MTGYCLVQVDPNSIAARDGRIREGDRILQVCDNRLFLKLFLQTNAQCCLLCGLLMREGILFVTVIDEKIHVCLFFNTMAGSESACTEK